MTGAEVRKSLGMMMGSGFSMYYGVCKALDQAPNLNPESSRFLTVKVGESHIGIGGIMYALMRFGFNVGGTASGDEPLNLVRLNRFDNPFIKFMYSRTSPLTGTLTNIAEGKNYFGEPLESTEDWARFMMEKVTPIAVQSSLERITTGQAPEPAVFIAEELGGRTFPKSEWELRDEARDRYSQQEYGMTYDNLPKLQQKAIDAKPDVQMLSTKADTQTLLREGLSKDFILWRTDRDSAKQTYLNRLNQLQGAVDAGLVDGYTFKEEMQTAGTGLGATYKYIDSQKQYQKVMDKLDQPKDINGQYLGDVVYDKLMAASFSDQFIDSKTGLMNWDMYNAFRDNLEQQYPEVWGYVEQREQQTRQDLPPMAQEYKHAQDVLKPYWQIESDLRKLYGSFMDTSRGQTLLSRIRKNLRRSDPEIDKYLTMFYTRV